MDASGVSEGAQTSLSLLGYTTEPSTLLRPLQLHTQKPQSPQPKYLNTSGPRGVIALLDSQNYSQLPVVPEGVLP